MRHVIAGILALVGFGHAMTSLVAAGGTHCYDVRTTGGVVASVLPLETEGEGRILLLVTSVGDPVRWYSFDETSGTVAVSVAGVLVFVGQASGPGEAPRTARATGAFFGRDVEALRAVGERGDADVARLVEAFGLGASPFDGDGSERVQVARRDVGAGNEPGRAAEQ